MAEYLTYPMKVLRITQSYRGTTSHKPHWYNRNTKSVLAGLKDYPTDNGGKDSGKDPVYATVDLIVYRVWGVGTKGVNTIFVETANKVKLANGKTDYACFFLTHPNDADLRKYKKGSKIKKGSIICYEGADGATANHVHMSVGLGKFTGNGWAANINGKYVITCTGGPLKPEEAFFVDPAFTKTVETASIIFKNLPSAKTRAAEAKSKYQIGNYIVKTSLLHVRTGPGTEHPVVPYLQLSADARQKIMLLNSNKSAAGYVKGITFSVSKISGDWGLTPSGWVCLNYCERLKG